jgi:hypothetical protein
MARYIISPGVMASRVGSAMLQVMQGQMPAPADCHIMPEFTEGETLGPGAVRARVSSKPV